MSPLLALVDVRSCYVETQLPWYYFDAEDGKRQFRDAVGKSLNSRAFVAIEANTLLTTLVEIMQIEGRTGAPTVSVRDEDGRQIYERSSLVDG